MDDLLELSDFKSKMCMLDFLKINLHITDSLKDGGEIKEAIDEANEAQDVEG
jgi:hypothetical protein